MAGSQHIGVVGAVWRRRRDDDNLLHTCDDRGHRRLRVGGARRLEVSRPRLVDEHHPRVFTREGSWALNPAHLERTRRFYERHGGKTIVIARFVPIVRTFAPVVAGVSGMRYRTFVTYNVVGGVLWGVGVTTLGYYLGQVDFVAEHIELILIGIVGLSVVPIAVELLRARSRSRDPRFDEPAERERVERENIRSED